MFDLDPAPDMEFAEVIAAAREVRDRLEALGLVSFWKTTGGKGRHVVAPLDVDWPAAQAFARDVCHAMANDAPDRFLIARAKKARGGRIFLDDLRNAPHGHRGAAAVAARTARRAGLYAAEPGAGEGGARSQDLYGPHRAAVGAQADGLERLL